ncbi:MAG: c-type cytochrome [Burkholderiales bacterium]|nr:c-type cytochrome [Burkholderiales bacterium]
MAAQRAIAAGVSVLMAFAAAMGVQAAPPHDLDDNGLYAPGELSAIYRHSPLKPLPTVTAGRVTEDTRAARLGQYLFFERRFSANGAVSCATCHVPEKAFADARRVGTGLAAGERNTPGLLNVAFERWYFWDGRADSLWAQALGPIENAKEFGGDRLNTLHLVAEDAPLRRAYELVFGPPPPLGDAERFPRHASPDSAPGSPAARAWSAMSLADRDAANRMYANLGKAIEAYERKLVDGDSAFDRYVAALKSGDRAGQRAYPAAAKRGLKLFVGAAQCELCHSGPSFSDGEFHNIGLPLLAGESADNGRAAGIDIVRASDFNGIGPYSDHPEGRAKDQLSYLPPPESQLGSFKTPNLRNVALTAPYMHDGRFDTLSAVLDFYAKGREASRGQMLLGEREATLDLVPRLSSDQADDLTAFLNTLTGRALPAELTTAPGEP